MGEGWCCISLDVQVEEKAYLDLDFTQFIKIDSRWSADLHVKGELLKFWSKPEYLYDLGVVKVS